MSLPLQYVGDICSFFRKLLKVFTDIPLQSFQTPFCSHSILYGNSTVCLLENIMCTDHSCARKAVLASLHLSHIRLNIYQYTGSHCVIQHVHREAHFPFQSNIKGNKSAASNKVMHCMECAVYVLVLSGLHLCHTLCLLASIYANHVLIFPSLPATQ